MPLLISDSNTVQQVVFASQQALHFFISCTNIEGTTQNRHIQVPYTCAHTSTDSLRAGSARARVYGGRRHRIRGLRTVFRAGVVKCGC